MSHGLEPNLWQCFCLNLIKSKSYKRKQINRAKSYTRIVSIHVKSSENGELNSSPIRLEEKEINQVIYMQELVPQNYIEFSALYIYIYICVGVTAYWSIIGYNTHACTSAPVITESNSCRYITESNSGQ